MIDLKWIHDDRDDRIVRKLIVIILVQDTMIGQQTHWHMDIVAGLKLDMQDVPAVPIPGQVDFISSQGRSDHLNGEFPFDAHPRHNSGNNARHVLLKGAFERNIVRLLRGWCICHCEVPSTFLKPMQTVVSRRVKSDEVGIKLGTRPSSPPTY